MAGTIVIAQSDSPDSPGAGKGAISLPTANNQIRLVDGDSGDTHVIALPSGGGTVTIPAAGTVALLATTNVFTANQRVNALVGINNAPTSGQQVTVKADAASTSALVVDTAASPTAPVYKASRNGTDRYSQRVEAEYFKERIINYFLANDATIDLGNIIAVVEVINATNGRYARFFCKGGGGAVDELEDPDNNFSTTKDTASNINVYNESSSYFIQNKRGSSMNLGIRVTQAFANA